MKQGGRSGGQGGGMKTIVCVGTVGLTREQIAS